MRHMGISGKIAIGAFLAALALLVLTGITLHETVLLWFVGASATAYVACVAEVVVRRRHKTLAASGLGSILFIAFGIAFLRQWGLAFNPDPDALSTRVDSAHPDLYFYLAAAAGAVTLLLLFAGTVLPGRNRGRRSPGTASGRRPAAVSRAGARSAGPLPSAARPTARGTAARPAAPRAVARPAAKSPAQPSAKSPARVPSTKSTAARSPVRSPAPKSSVKPPAAKSPTRTSARR
ncbi:hypothetical protein [Arthrobacter sp. NicSoilB8]|uniref:hypothetical protein n=1 Tax=Arthrobacter sp. NicSoilB8 TaxID=2830998 RepID=UPI001CC3F118|nr:hypothetical protein [Arthrobacter sp. NicSoilB8]BCW69648.1 hypothetical protein NicSoilB8_06920 [Arthrobacter sp. NicSoilB8]